MKAAHQRYSQAWTCSEAWRFEEPSHLSESRPPREDCKWLHPTSAVPEGWRESQSAPKASPLAPMKGGQCLAGSRANKRRSPKRWTLRGVPLTGGVGLKHSGKRFSGLYRGFHKCECLTRSGVRDTGKSGQIIGAVSGQVCPPRTCTGEEPIGILVVALFPMLSSRLEIGSRVSPDNRCYSRRIDTDSLHAKRAAIARIIGCCEGRRRRTLDGVSTVSRQSQHIVQPWSQVRLLSGWCPLPYLADEPQVNDGRGKLSSTNRKKGKMAPT